MPASSSRIFRSFCRLYPVSVSSKETAIKSKHAQRYLRIKRQKYCLLQLTYSTKYPIFFLANNSLFSLFLILSPPLLPFTFSSSRWIEAYETATSLLLISTFNMNSKSSNRVMSVFNEYYSSSQKHCIIS